MEMKGASRRYVSDGVGVGDSDGGDWKKWC